MSTAIIVILSAFILICAWIGMKDLLRLFKKIANLLPTKVTQGKTDVESISLASMLPLMISSPFNGLFILLFGRNKSVMVPYRSSMCLSALNHLIRKNLLSEKEATTIYVTICNEMTQ